MEKTNETTNPKGLVKDFKADKIVMKLIGEAPKQYNPNPVNISGTISAPSRFLEYRKDEFYNKKAYCMASKTEGTLVLTVNEQSTCDKYVISGSINDGKLFTKIGINNADINYEPLKLARKFRMLKSIFTSNAEYFEITSKLRNLIATVNKKVEESEDDRANTKKLFEQTVESNIPESFKLKLPLLEGENPVEIDVQVILEVHNGKIVCFLESVEAKEIMDNEKERLVNEEVTKIEQKVLVVFH